MRIKKALIVTKITRYEFEKIRHPGLNNAELEEKIRARGTDYDALMHYHNLHKNQETKVVNSFKEMGVEVVIANRLEIRKELLSWCDLLVPVGGDGTFLLAASRASPFFVERSIPIVGINSDPNRSEGRLLLPKHYSVNIEDAVKKILTGDFEWMHRSRIRITLLGFNGNGRKPPVPLDMHEYNSAPIEHKEVIISEPSLLDQINGCTAKKGQKKRSFTKRTLPYLALNEVSNFSKVVNHR
jgi:NAD+ kinase